MKVIPSVRFDYDLSKLVRGNTKLLKKVDKCLRILSTNIHHPSLRTHKLAGLELYSISVDMKIRILFYFEGEDVYLIRIGTHEEVY